MVLRFCDIKNTRPQIHSSRGQVFLFAVPDIFSAIYG